MTTDATDEQLMSRYGRGDAVAFRTLYQRHKDPLYRYCLRAGVRPADAAELAQDVWLRVINARTQYQPTAKFTTWLYRIAHNRVVDHWRAAGTTAQHDESALDALPATRSSGPEVQAMSADCLKLLLAALGQLPQEQREIVLLKEEGQLTLEEMAAVQGVGRETAKSRLRYALAKLKEALGDCLS